MVLTGLAKKTSIRYDGRVSKVFLTLFFFSCLFFTLGVAKSYALTSLPTATSSPEIITENTQQATLTISGIDPSFISNTAINWEIQIVCGGGSRSPGRIPNSQITKAADSLSFTMDNTPPPFGIDCKFASGNAIELDVYKTGELFGKSRYRVVKVTTAPSQCTIQNPTSVVVDNPFDVVVTSQRTEPTIQWTIAAGGNQYRESQIFSRPAGPSITFTFTNELLPDTYYFIVVGRATAANGRTTTVASCVSANRTVVQPDPSVPTPTPGGPNLCWYITGTFCDSACLVGGRFQAGRPGQYATEQECRDAVNRNFLTTLPLTPIYFKPTLCDGDRGVQTALGCLPTAPAALIGRIFGIVLGLAGGIALLLIIYSGYRMIATTGNPEALQGARETLTSAIVGLLFIIFSFVILEIIGVDILRIPTFGAGRFTTQSGQQVPRDCLDNAEYALFNRNVCPDNVVRQACNRLASDINDLSDQCQQGGDPNAPSCQQLAQLQNIQGHCVAAGF